MYDPGALFRENPKPPIRPGFPYAIGRGCSPSVLRYSPPSLKSAPPSPSLTTIQQVNPPQRSHCQTKYVNVTQLASRWADNKEDNAVAGLPMLSDKASMPPTKVGFAVTIHLTNISVSLGGRSVRAMGLLDSCSSSTEDLHSLVVTKRKHSASLSSAKPDEQPTRRVRTGGSVKQQVVKISEERGGSGGAGLPRGEVPDEVSEQDGGGHERRPY